MIPFEEIDSRLESLGKDRVWLVAASGRSSNSIRAALAPNAPKAKRSELIQKALSDAIEREESRLVQERLQPAFERQQLVLRPSDAEYAEWCQAASGASVQAWAQAALNRAAARYLSSLEESRQGPVAVPDAAQSA